MKAEGPRGLGVEGWEGRAVRDGWLHNEVVSLRAAQDAVQRAASSLARGGAVLTVG